MKFDLKEKKMIDNIGSENFDYCLTAVLQKRFPDHNISLKEDEEVICIDNSVDLEFNPEIWDLDSKTQEESILMAVSYIGSLFIKNNDELA